MKGSIAFLLGCFIGSVITQVWMEKHPSEKPVEKLEEAPEKESSQVEDKEPEKKAENKEGFREKTTIDDYKAVTQEEQTAYNKIVKAHYDPANDESPKEDDDSLDQIHEEVKNNPPREISEKEFGTFGYAQSALYYDPEYDLLTWDEEQSETIDDPTDEYRVVGDALKYSGFKTDPSLSTLWIRNYRLRTDYVIYKK